MRRQLWFGVLLACALILVATGAVVSANDTAHVYLFNDDKELKGDPWYLECQNVGKLYSGDPLPTNLDKMTCRARTGNIAGPWFEHVIDDQDLQVEYASVHIELYNGEEILTDTDKYYLEIQNIGKLGTCETFHVPADADVTYRARTGNIAGPWKTQSWGPGEHELRVEYATVTPNLFNGEETLADAGVYFLEVQNIGNQGHGQTFHVPADANVTYRARTGNIAGPWKAESWPGGDVTLSVEYATVTPHLFNGPKTLDNTDLYYLEIQNIGNRGTGQVFHVPAGANVTYRARTGNIAGPWITTSWPAGDLNLAIEYASVHIRLFNGDKDLEKEEGYYLEIQNIGRLGTCDTFHVPAGAKITFRARTGNIAGPWMERVWEAGEQELEIEYATVHVTLHNDNVPLEDREVYYLEIQNIGKIGHCQVFHVPPKAQITWRARTSNIAGPWKTKKWNRGGEHEWAVEYATVHVTLHNNGKPLTDDRYFLEIQNIGERRHCQYFHVPARAKVTFRARTGNIAGRWLTKSWGAGERELSVEYATVKFVFDLAGGGACTLETEVQNFGNVPNGDVGHFPDRSTITFRARLCGYYTGWFTQQVRAGEGTITWSLTPKYTRP